MLPTAVGRKRNFFTLDDINGLKQHFLNFLSFWKTSELHLESEDFHKKGSYERTVKSRLKIFLINLYRIL